MIFLVNNMEEKTSIGKIVAYFGILAIICVVSFLTAKYIVRSSIKNDEMPIDTSVRLK